MARGRRKAEEGVSTVFFATNRDLIGTKAKPDFGKRFNSAGPSAIRFGYAEVPDSCFTFRRDGTLDDSKLEAIRIYVAPEDIDLEHPENSKLGSLEVFRTVREKMRKHSRDTVAFVHGYANSFRSAVRHAGWLKKTYDAIPFNIFLFSWPSDGEMVPIVSYYSDRDDARASGSAIARTFLKMQRFLEDTLEEARETGTTPCEQRLHLMAHSMGNYALRHAIQAIRKELGDEPPRVFDNIFLFAADEDDDAFEHDHKLRLLPRLGRQVSVYFNPGDLALLISDKTKLNPDRLGSDGPRLTDDLPRKVVLLDCRDVARTDDRDRRGHDYHRYVREVVADVNAVFRGIPADENPLRKYMPESRSYRIQRSPTSAAEER